ncbi:putative eukaryotic translation initiation factor 3 subunit [Gregarina niphandrodes]|uniref:Serine-threonine kinase receptor-associated protein n=1 Tax=Gregarina niphandrodes TaxID=110365 RepID=A0A023BBB5_GRENI|nr:putative eukaryotic translation initiation factor 3 subunit [Gregarina niphandrodes]EZG79400.1 putative eukaryotic translation initiation factor 3 subunit [Gregarina niphandrodes]|eukprot:XP_011129047.1 putative eukaryotic translation initiation factor 3 subunit [Gregarina niphandrodes]
MRSITVRASEAKVTCVKINEDGDLLFTSGSDDLVSVWRLSNGDRLGTYHLVHQHEYDWNIEQLRESLTRAHRVVSHLDVNRKSTELAVCRFDTVVIYDVCSGRLLNVLNEGSKVECVEWNRNPLKQDMLLVGIKPMGGECAVPMFKVYKCDDLDDPNRLQGSRHWDPVCEIKNFDGMPTICGWGPYDKFVIGGTDSGKLYKWDLNGKAIDMKQAHTGAITCISFNKDRSIFVTTSLDRSAKIWNTTDFSIINTILADRPLHACSLNPLFDEEDQTKRKTTIILSGGQEASEVTTSAADAGMFEILLVDAITGEEENRITAHYSPTLCLYYHPNGKIIATGAYEGNSKVIFLN